MAAGAVKNLQIKISLTLGSDFQNSIASVRNSVRSALVAPLAEARQQLRSLQSAMSNIGMKSVGSSATGVSGVASSVIDRQSERIKKLTLTVKELRAELKALKSDASGAAPKSTLAGEPGIWAGADIVGGRALETENYKARRQKLTRSIMGDVSSGMVSPLYGTPDTQNPLKRYSSEELRIFNAELQRTKNIKKDMANMARLQSQNEAQLNSWMVKNAKETEKQAIAEQKILAAIKATSLERVKAFTKDVRSGVGAKGGNIPELQQIVPLIQNADAALGKFGINVKDVHTGFGKIVANTQNLIRWQAQWFLGAATIFTVVSMLKQVAQGVVEHTIALSNARATLLKYEVTANGVSEASKKMVDQIVLEARVISTEVPIAFEEIIKAAERLQAAGIKSEIVLGVLKDFASIQAVFPEIEPEEFTKSVVGLYNTFKDTDELMYKYSNGVKVARTEQEKFRDIIDKTMVALAESPMAAKDLPHIFQHLSQISQAAGFTHTQILALSAIFTKLGGNAALAARSFRQLISSLVENKGQEALKSIGYTLDKTKTVAEQFPKIIAALQKAVGSGNKGFSAGAVSLFGELTTVAGEGTLIALIRHMADYEKMQKKLGESSGITEQMLKVYTDGNLKAQLVILSNAWKEFTYELTKGVSPIGELISGGVQLAGVLLVLVGPTEMIRDRLSNLPTALSVVAGFLATLNWLISSLVNELMLGVETTLQLYKAVYQLTTLDFKGAFATLTDSGGEWEKKLEKRLGVLAKGSETYAMQMALLTGAKTPADYKQKSAEITKTPEQIEAEKQAKIAASKQELQNAIRDIETKYAAKIKILHQELAAETEKERHRLEIIKITEDAATAIRKTHIDLETDMNEQFFQNNMISFKKYQETKRKLEKETHDISIVNIDRELQKQINASDIAISNAQREIDIREKELKELKSKIGDAAKGRGAPDRELTKLVGGKEAEKAGFANIIVQEYNKQEELGTKAILDKEQLWAAYQASLAKQDIPDLLKQNQALYNATVKNLTVDKERNQVLLEANEIAGNWNEVNKLKLQVMQQESDLKIRAIQNDIKKLEIIKETGGLEADELVYLEEKKKYLIEVGKLEQIKISQEKERQNSPFSFGLKNAVKEWDDYSKQMVSIAEGAAQAMQQAFSGYFFDLFSGKLKTWKDHLRGFLESIQKMIADMIAKLIAKYIALWIVQMITGTASSGNYNTSSSTGFAATGGQLNMPMHTGGLVMHTGGLVPRYHGGGMAHDERPAILQTGEYVVSRKGVKTLDRINSGDPGGMGNPINITVAVENKSSQQVKAKQSDVNYDRQTKQYIVGVVMEDLNTNGPIKQTIGR